MALTRTARAGDGPRRRTLLAGGAAALLATGCSGGHDRAADDRARAGERLRARAAHDSAALLAAYDATLAAHAGLAGRLRPLRAEVARHAEAFGSATPAASPSAAPAPAPSVPRDERSALAALADAERRTADGRAAALASAPPELARLLASVAAAGAAHAYLLGVAA
ncbi:hypothetical protein [Streptomyces caatingaensis]|uniref:Lipoprotein n=1 Tax=Streptomyces caatingaensis TaxID=1678637 RepID=A0A0K9XCU4_9ACTN|nr:hypothetical protein [Streptomyces caatingaensis]KNB51190.1 lipoprotein [Streptomyces caatingaensis]